MKTFVINLARATDRRVHMARQFEALGATEVEFFEAVDGRALDLDNAPLYDRQKRLDLYGIDLTPGEIGCYLSHYQVLRRIQNEGLERALVLEDDVVLHPRTFDVAERVAGLPQDYEFIRFGGAREPAHLSLGPVMDGFELRRLLNVTSEMSGYAVSRAGAARLLACGAEMVRQIDVTVDRYWESGLPIYALHPYPVNPAAFDSTIGDRVDVWKLPGMAHWRKKTKRLKRAESIGKRVANLKIRAAHLLAPRRPFA